MDVIPLVELGNTGQDVSALCLGTDYYGSRTSTDVAWQLLDEFAARGGTFLDTANVYACFVPGFVGGESETVLGDWMTRRGNRARMFVATKVAGAYQDAPSGLRATDIVRECERSLRRLRSDVIDLYYAHTDDRNTPLDEILSAFHDLVIAGKVRFVGLSNWQLWRLAEARLLAELRGWSRPVALEFRHTYLRPAADTSFGLQVPVTDQLIDFAKSRQLALVAYSVLLNGAYTRPDRPVPWQYRGPDTDARLEALREVADDLRTTPNHVVIAWLTRSDPPIIPIVGGSTTEQVRQNIEAALVHLSAEQVARLNAAGSPTPAGD
jgi:aryl-alcohol dehydrogenase-like predicted oxidoreductase